MSITYPILYYEIEAFGSIRNVDANTAKEIVREL